MKNNLLLTLLLCLCSTALFAQFDAEEYKGKSNAEIISNLKIAVEQIESLERFEKMFSDDDNKGYTKDELVPVFRPDTTEAIAAYRELLSARLTLEQTFSGKGTALKIDDGDFHASLSGKTYSIKLVPKKIYFYDGSSTTENVDKIDLDLSFSENVPYRKRIDSIAFDLTFKYSKAFDKIEVNSLKPFNTYKGHFLKILKTNKNDIEYIYSKDLDFDFIEGLNAAGKPLDDKSQRTSDYRQKGFGTFFSIKKQLETIVAAAEKDSSMASEKFQQKYFGMIESEFSKIPDSDTMYREAKYKGAIKGLRAYFVTEKKEQTTALTIKAATSSDVHSSYNGGDSTVIYDNESNVIFASAEGVYPVNAFFYANDKSFFYFNRKAKKMEKLPYYTVEALTENYVSAQEDENAPYLLLNDKNERVGSFESLSSYDQTVIALQDKDALIITADHKQVRLKNLEHISDMNNGYAAVKLNGKFGFIDANGKQLIPAIYDGAEPFGRMDGYTDADLFFAVKKGDKWGFVDAQNKTVIPFEYDEVEPFSYGITMAIKNGNRGLINTRNEIIAPFMGGTSYSMSTNFGKRHYSIGAGSYNHLGKKEKN